MVIYSIYTMVHIDLVRICPMIILSLKCSNIFMFHDFQLDFTYPRKTKYDITIDEVLFPESKINVRKRLVILGGNASGKTTFGKLLCAITNYLAGREVEDKRINLFHALYHKEERGYFEIEFAINRMAYWLRCEFDNKQIIREELKRERIYKSYNISTLRDKLYGQPNLMSYAFDKDSPIKSNRSFGSVLLRRPDHEKILKDIRENLGFHYFFSRFADSSKDAKIQIPVSFIDKILPKIDNSIDRVAALAVKDEAVKTESYIILFKNGDQITIPEGNLALADKERLSHGTYEALYFLSALEEMKQRAKDLIFVDEKLAHLHTELEAYLIMKAFWVDHAGQVFFTSHNSELLDLNLPNHAFLLFRRNEDNYNQALYVSDRLTKNDRSVRNYYENDYFGVLPDYSVLDEFFEDEDDE